MATKRGRTAEFPDQYDKFDDMNAYAVEWRKEVVKAKEENRKPGITTDRLMLRLYNACLEYVNNGINKTRTVIADIPEEEWGNIELYDAGIEALEEEIRQIEQKIAEDRVNTDREELLQLKKNLTAKKARLETKKFETEEWKKFAEYQKTEETLKAKKAALAEQEKTVTNPEEKKRLKKQSRETEKELLANANNLQRIKNRWAQKETFLLTRDSDIREAWLSVMGEALTQALKKYEKAAGGPSDEKPFSLWLMEQIPNAKQRIGLIGTTLLVEPQDAYYETLSYKAKQYLKSVCKERNINGFEMPRHIYTPAFLAAQLQKTGFSAEEAEEQAKRIFSDRNISMDEIAEDSEGAVQTKSEHYIHARRLDKKIAKEASESALLEVYQKITEDTKLSALLFPYIQYFLTAQLFEKKLSEKKVYKHIIHRRFYEILLSGEEEANAKNVKPEKPHVLLAKMLKLESETVRKNFKKAQHKLVNYYNAVLAGKNDDSGYFLP